MYSVWCRVYSAEITAHDAICIFVTAGGAVDAGDCSQTLPLASLPPTLLSLLTNYWRSGAWEPWRDSQAAVSETCPGTL